jgi:hypothetical protein
MPDPVVFSICNSTGRELQTGISNHGKIDVRNLPPGIYYLNALYDEYIISEKFVKL